MADLGSTRIFGKLTVMHDSLIKGEVEAASFKGDGSGLTGIAGIPSGVITMWSGSTASIPSGWALCNGANGTPDLRNRFVVGAGSSYGVGATGGASTVALTEAEMPTHSHSASSGNAGSHAHTGGTSTNGYHGHSGSTNTTGNHAHSVPTADTGASTSGGTSQWITSSDKTDFYADKYLPTQGAGNHNHSLSINGNGNHTHSLNINSAGSHSHTVSIGNAGSSSAHENRPPYYALAYIMKV